MARRMDRTVLAAVISNWHECIREEWHALGTGPPYNEAQRLAALELAREHGVVRTAKILRIGRRTIQRWSKAAGQINGTPGWVRLWAARRRRFLERIGLR